MALSKNLLLLVVIIPLLSWESLGDQPEPAVVMGANSVILNFNKKEYMVSKCDKTTNFVVLLSKPVNYVVTAAIRITPADTPINCNDICIDAVPSETDDCRINIPSNTTSKLVCVNFNKPVNFQLHIQHHGLSAGVTPGYPETADVIFYDITLSFTNALYTVNEDNRTAQLELMLSEPTCSTISVYVKIQQITPKEGKNYDATIRTLFFGGKTSATFDVNIIDNEKLESNQSFYVSIDPLSLPYCIVLGNVTTAEVVILDDDVANVSFEIIRYAVNEGDGQVELALNLSHPLPHEFDARLRLNSIDDTNTTENLRCHYKDGANYGVTIPANMTNFKYNFTIFDDDILEINETINLVIDSASHNQIRIINPYEASVTIMDDEERITVNFSEEEFTFNEADGIVSPVLTLSKPSPCCLNLYVEVEDVTAFGRGVDYGEKENETQIANKTQGTNEVQSTNETQSGNKTQYLVTFPAGTTCSSVDIPINNDSISEDNEAFNISILIMSLPFGVKLGGIDEAKVVIIDNDIVLGFNDTVYYFHEDDHLFCFNLTLDKPAVFDISVEVIEENVTATRNDDYKPGPYSVNIFRGNESILHCIMIKNDTKLEMNETFKLRFNKSALNPNVVTAPNEAEVIIMDDEYVIYFDPSVYTVVENENAVTMTLKFSSKLPKEVVVNISYVDLTTSDEFDYYALTNSVTIPKDAVNFSLCIEIVDDGRFETNELLRVFAIPPVLPDGYVYSTADLIIFDDDDFVVEFKSQSYVVDSKNDKVEVILQFKFPDEFNIAHKLFPIDVTVTEIDITATGGVDYTPLAELGLSSYSFEYNPSGGIIERKLILRTIDDNLVEPNETYFLNITTQAYHVKIGKKATITIVDDDGAPVLGKG